MTGRVSNIGQSALGGGARELGVVILTPLGEVDTREVRQFPSIRQVSEGRVPGKGSPKGPGEFGGPLRIVQRGPVGLQGFRKVARP